MKQASGEQEAEEEEGEVGLRDADGEQPERQLHEGHEEGKKGEEY